MLKYQLEEELEELVLEEELEDLLEGDVSNLVVYNDNEPKSIRCMKFFHHMKM